MGCAGLVSQTAGSRLHKTRNGCLQSSVSGQTEHHQLQSDPNLHQRDQGGRLRVNDNDPKEEVHSIGREFDLNEAWERVKTLTE